MIVYPSEHHVVRPSCWPPHRDVIFVLLYRITPLKLFLGPEILEPRTQKIYKRPLIVLLYHSPNDYSECTFFLQDLPNNLDIIHSFIFRLGAWICQLKYPCYELSVCVSRCLHQCHSSSPSTHLPTGALLISLQFIHYCILGYRRNWRERAPVHIQSPELFRRAIESIWIYLFCDLCSHSIRFHCHIFIL